jgi:hypothetical protein
MTQRQLKGEFGMKAVKAVKKGATRKFLAIACSLVMVASLLPVGVVQTYAVDPPPRFTLEFAPGKSLPKGTEVETASLSNWVAGVSLGAPPTPVIADSSAKLSYPAPAGTWKYSVVSGSSWMAVRNVKGEIFLSVTSIPAERNATATIKASFSFKDLDAATTIDDGKGGHLTIDELDIPAFEPEFTVVSHIDLSALAFDMEAQLPVSPLNITLDSAQGQQLPLPTIILHDSQSGLYLDDVVKGSWAFPISSPVGATGAFVAITSDGRVTPSRHAPYGVSVSFDATFDARAWLSQKGISTQSGSTTWSSKGTAVLKLPHGTASVALEPNDNNGAFQKDKESGIYYVDTSKVKGNELYFDVAVSEFDSAQAGFVGLYGIESVGVDAANSSAGMSSVFSLTGPFLDKIDALNTLIESDPSGYASDSRYPTLVQEASGEILQGKLSKIDTLSPGPLTLTLKAVAHDDGTGKDRAPDASSTVEMYLYDSTQLELEVNMDYTGLVTTDGDYYFGANSSPPGSLSRTITITETNQKVPLRPLQYSYQGPDATAPLQQRTLAFEKDNKTGAYKAVWSHTPGEEGVYTFYYEDVEDIFGNKVKVTYGDSTVKEVAPSFTIDTTAPSARVDAQAGSATKPGSVNGFLNSLTFGLIANDEISVMLAAEDELSGAYELVYHVDTFDDKAQQNPVRLEDAKSLEAKASNYWTLGGLSPAGQLSYQVGPLTHDTYERFVYYLCVTDRAGNKSYASSATGVIYDNHEPAVAIEPQRTPVPSIYDESADIVFDWSANDRNNYLNTITGNPEYCSGLAEVRYEIFPDGVNAYGDPVILFASDMPKDGPGLGDIGDSEQRSGTITLPAAELPALNGNAVILKLTATDRAGNQRFIEYSFAIDTTPPEVTVHYDNNDVANGRYYNKGRVATITIKDLNFDTVRSVMDTDGAWSGGWIDDDPTYTEDGLGVWVSTVTFDTDGEYHLSLTVVDKVGHVTSYPAAGESDTFIVDTAVPVVSITYDNNDVHNERYYNTQRTATVTIIEQFFEEGQGAEVAATFDGEPFVTSGGWTSVGDTHTLSVPCGADGEYTLSASYINLAGTAANVIDADSFIIDATKPSLEFRGPVQDQTAFNSDTITPEVALRDIHFDDASVEVSLSKASLTSAGASVAPLASTTALDDGHDILIGAHNASIDRASDGIYTLNVQVGDLAGNITVESITYSVNRFGSTWYVQPGSPTADLLSRYYTNKPIDVELHEVNACELTFSQVSYSFAGKVVSLERNTDYGLGFAHTGGLWKDYTYTLYAPGFTQEGIYEVTVYSEDRARNSSTNRSPRSDAGSPTDSLPIRFAVDTTAPSIVVTGVEDGGNYVGDERIVKIDVQDNLALDTVKLYLNGNTTPEATYTEQDLKEMGGVAELHLEASSDYQSLTVTAQDMAGNEARPLELANILISPTPLAHYVNTVTASPVIPWIIAGVAFLAVALLVSLFLLRRLRGRNKIGARP